jgi:nitrite reductase/ring-hydroxylating ferredoxin subunit
MAARERLICASGDLVDGKDGVRFETINAGQSAPAFVIRHHGKAYAYLNRCGHVPVEIDWQQGKFFDHSGIYLICATHGALYAPNSGQCLAGKCAGRGLKALAVIERDNGIYVSEEDD